MLCKILYFFFFQNKTKKRCYCVLFCFDYVINPQWVDMIYFPVHVANHLHVYGGVDIFFTPSLAHQGLIYWSLMMHILVA